MPNHETSSECLRRQCQWNKCVWVGVHVCRCSSTRHTAHHIALLAPATLQQGMYTIYQAVILGNEL